MVNLSLRLMKIAEATAVLSVCQCQSPVRVFNSCFHPRKNVNLKAADYEFQFYSLASSGPKFFLFSLTMISFLSSSKMAKSFLNKLNDQLS